VVKCNQRATTRRRGELPTPLPLAPSIYPPTPRTSANIHPKIASRETVAPLSLRNGWFPLFGGWRRRVVVGGWWEGGEPEETLIREVKPIISYDELCALLEMKTS